MIKKQIFIEDLNYKNNDCTDISILSSYNNYTLVYGHYEFRYEITLSDKLKWGYYLKQGG